MASCASGYMSQNEITNVIIGGHEFSYSMRRHHNRCDYVCGGFTGLHASGKWSTWSPGRFPIPENDEVFLPALMTAAAAYKKRPREKGGFFHFLMPGNRINYSCNNCSLVCHQDKATRVQRYKMLTESGVVLQNPDGSLEAVSPDEAIHRLKVMPPEQRGLYEMIG